MWYISTEPLRQLKDVFKLLGTLNKAFTWIYIFVGLALLFLITGKTPYAGVVFILLAITIILSEWQSGYFMQRYRQKIKSRVRRDLNKYEQDKLEGDEIERRQ